MSFCFKFSLHAVILITFKLFLAGSVALCCTVNIETFVWPWLFFLETIFLKPLMGRKKKLQENKVPIWPLDVHVQFTKWINTATLFYLKEGLSLEGATEILLNKYLIWESRWSLFEPFPCVHLIVSPFVTCKTEPKCVLMKQVIFFSHLEWYSKLGMWWGNMMACNVITVNHCLWATKQLVLGKSRLLNISDIFFLNCLTSVIHCWKVLITVHKI